MNWNRIINIFIVLFLIINIAIHYVIHYRNEQQYVLSEERKSQLREILYENGFALYTHVPDNFPMKKIILHSPQNDKDKIAKKIFEDESYTRTFLYNSENYTSNKQELQFLKGDQKGVILYSGTNENYIPKSSSKEDIEAAAKKFAKDITLSDPKLKLTLSKKFDDYYILEYNEIYKGNIIFCNYVRIKASEKGIEEASVLRYAPERLTGRKQKLFPADEVLYNFAQSVFLEDEELYSIKNIDLGYDLGINNLADNVLAEAVPYYRIKLHNEQVYYINAYTNELRITE